jgi:hypothetical protein
VRRKRGSEGGIGISLLDLTNVDSLSDCMTVGMALRKPDLNDLNGPNHEEGGRLSVG